MTVLHRVTQVRVKDFSAWPQDGLIVFIGCVVGLICLLGARLADRPAFHEARQEGDSFRMRPLPSSAVTGFGLILSVVLVTYAVSKAHPQSHNQQVGMCVALGFWLIAIYFVYANFLVRYSFNAEGFCVVNTLLGAKRFPWASLVGLGHEKGNPILYFSQQAYRFPYALSGRRQLVCLVDSQVLRMTAPLLPVYDASTLRELIGKSGLVNLLQCDATNHPTLLRSRVGTLDSVRPDTVTIRFEDGTTFEASANLRSIRPGNRKSAWIASWYVDANYSAA